MTTKEPAVEDQDYNITFFNSIIQTRGMTAIERQCEDWMEEPTCTGADRETCQKILEQKNLDPIYILCHDRLVYIHMEKAQVLREWVARKETKKC
jgi:hypothetical protein